MTPHLPPVSDTFEPQPPTSMPLPIFTLDYVAPSLDTLSLSGARTGPVAEPAPSRVVDETNGVASSSTKPDDWMWATLTRNKRVTKEGWYQDVREIELDIEDDEKQASILVSELKANHSTGYAPGSICNIQPRSSPTEVNEFIEAMDFRSEADRPFTIRSTLPGRRNLQSNIDHRSTSPSPSAIL